LPTLDERWQANGRAVTQHRKAVGMKVVRMKAALTPAAPTVRQATVLRSQPHDSRQLACHTAARTALLVLCLCLRGVTAHAVEATAAAREFAVTILPLLEQKCLGCHGGDPTDIKGEYRVDSRAHLLAGGESGDAAVIPGMPEQGSLLGALRWDSLEMPPKENDRLTSEQIDAVSRWIAAGAPWPDAEEIASYRAEALQEPSTAAGVLVATSGGTSDASTMRR
jgi:mono/diheme cytochrome c family protein